MTTLSLRLLGDIQILRDGEPVSGFVTRKAQALLLYLAATQTPHSREKIAGLFWPEMPEQSARNNLRRTLPNLRKLLGDYLTIDHHTIAFNRNAPYELDIERFSGSAALLPAKGELSATTLAVLAEKAALYRGDFLQDFHLPDTPDFDEWLLLKRESLRQQALQLLTILAEHYLQVGNSEAGLATTRRLLAIEPWYETAHQQQMLLLAQSGQRAAALAQYETCRAFLATEFGVEPSAAMTAQYDQIKTKLESVPQERQSVVPPDGTAAPTLSLVASVAPTLASGDIPRPVTFYGRQEELAMLTHLLTIEQTALVGLLGTGGTGKTVLAAELVRVLCKAERSASPLALPLPHFAHILWRSLINAPSLATVLTSWLQTIDDRRQDQQPATVNEQVDLLFTHLRQKHYLLVLDNLESLLQTSNEAGAFGEEYIEYEHFFRRLGETEHRSCLLFTSRELPLVVGRLERSYPLVRTYPVRGLDTISGVRLMKAEGVNGAHHELVDLVQRYSGNPLALKLVAETVQDLFGGDVQMLLQDRTLIFDDIRTVLDQQAKRLSPLEMEILCWLAIERAPTSLRDLTQNWLHPPPRAQFLDAVRALQRRGLLEHAVDIQPTQLQSSDRTMRFALQNVVMEYVSEFLIEQFYHELVRGIGVVQAADTAEPRQLWLNRFGLVKAQAQAYLRDIQVRLLLQPLMRRLLGYWGSPAIVTQLCQWLESLRRTQRSTRGYAGANLLHLLGQLDVPLVGWDFSHLPMRQADLRMAAVAGINLQGADLTGAAFIHTIGIIPTLAVSPDGTRLAAGSSDGAIYVWRIVDYHLEQVLHLHTQSVSSVQFSHDGAVLASSGLDGVLGLWQVENGQLLRTFSHEGKSIIAITFTPDDRYLAAAVSDELVHIWDRQQGQVIDTLAISATITGMALSPDGQWLVCVGDKRLIKVWHFPRRTVTGILRGHDDKILAVAIDPQGQRVATGGEDGRICLWNIATLTFEQALLGHTDLVLTLAFDPSGNFLASNSADQTTRLWHTASGKLVHVLRGHRGWVCGLAFSRNGQTLYTGGYDQTIRLWELKNGVPQHQLIGYNNRVDYLCFSHDGALLAASGLDGTVRLWDARSETLVQTLRGPKAAVRGLAFSRDDSLFATASDDGSVRVWESMTGQPLHTLIGHAAPARIVRFAVADRYLLSGSHDKTIAIWDVATGSLQREIANAVATSCFAFSCHPVYPQFAYATHTHELTVFDLLHDQIVQQIDIAPFTANTVVYSPDGQLLACGTQEGNVLIYDLTINVEAATPRYHVQATEMPIWSMHFSPDGHWLAWVCAGQQIYRLNLQSGQLNEPTRSYLGAFCLGFDRSSQSFFTDSTDNSVLVRDVATGNVHQRFRGHKAGLTSIEVSPVGDAVASSSVDGSVRLWHTTTGECLAILEAPGPYAGMQIHNATGISSAQRQALIELGAIDKEQEVAVVH